MSIMYLPVTGSYLTPLSWRASVGAEISISYQYCCSRDVPLFLGLASTVEEGMPLACR